MPRGLSETQKALLAQRVRSVAHLIELALDGGTVRAWDGVGDLNVLDATWKGLGQFGVISGLESDRALKSQSISIGLHGIPSDALTGSILSETRAEKYQNRPLTIWLVFLDPDTGAVVDVPVVIWSGLADAITFQLGESVTISLTAEHFASRARRSNGNRMTTQSHNARLGNPDPPDLLFDPQDRLMGRAKVQI